MHLRLLLSALLLNGALAAATAAVPAATSPPVAAREHSTPVARRRLAELNGPEGGVLVTGLTTEFAQNPLGVDVPRPRFGWKLSCLQRGAHQAAYRVRVAT